MHSLKDKVRFVQKVFGTCVLGNDGINISVCCPNSKCSSYGKASKKKLVIRIDTDQHHCWVCDLKGKNLKGLLKKYHPQYLDEYAQSFLGYSLKNVAHELDAIDVEIAIPDKFVLLATSLNSKDPDIRDAIRYVFSRGLTKRDLWYFKMGTCAEGRYRRRVILPSFDVDGNLNYFVARSIESDARMKYINAKVPKKGVIFNEINIDWNQELTLVEGPFDLTKCDDNATCLLGSTLGEDYALFHNIVKNQTPVLLAMDPDVKKKAHDIAKKLAEFGIEVRMLDLGSHSDVGEMSKLDFISAKARAKEWEADDRLYDLISSIRSGSLV
jgi:hypothetical protein